MHRTMWLLSTARAELHYFPDPTRVPGGYAILSHVWDKKEDSFQSVREAVGETFGDMQVECKCKGELEALREENERLKEELRRMRMGLGV